MYRQTRSQFKLFTPLNALVTASWRYIYWLPTAFVVSYYFVNLKIISGRSMQPTLNPDFSLWRDVGLFNRYAIHAKLDFARGDIVALRSPENPNRVLVKRIVGLPGDRVKTLPPYPTPEITVPQGQAWIEGDEPFHSDDSNRFGPVPLALIESRLISVVWPPSRFGHLFRSQPTPSKKNISTPQEHSAYQLAMAELDRQRWRSTRVTAASRNST
ncbi:peptidase S24/S26A/S26B/S26C [Lentinula raphanica]|uniref:Mitochondrial inner membrane protease subunit n=1 Tax=Lentinula raphanica TaxID=153919 RepID=A0AA38P7P1_9AGAR|nr:LexA signal peptidase [Lentinula raphanica]KAJ3837863.1 peptidase S24/S26A/S26B/S26C [Lentinula raphanica]